MGNTGPVWFVDQSSPKWGVKFTRLHLADLDSEMRKMCQKNVTHFSAKGGC